MIIDDPEPPSLRDLSIPALVHLRDQVVAELATRRGSTSAEVVRLYPSNAVRFVTGENTVTDCTYSATGDREDER